MREMLAPLVFVHKPFQSLGINVIHWTGHTMNRFHGLLCQLYDAESEGRTRRVSIRGYNTVSNKRTTKPSLLKRAFTLEY